MSFKFLIAFVEDSLTDPIMDAARDAGATGCTVINNARGEGLRKTRGIFGLELQAQRDVLLFLVNESLADAVMQRIAEVGQFDDTPGTGIVLQLDVENALGVSHQMQSLHDKR
ncbi:P-II family nitrogen regulator [Salinispirillum sp. LH 10-3-1]|uniref:P-II family nitrogen regulator n=1 Tax=Salinispirillum sp. LH 10-3-1 TaxID=2952525 RepID=A0AB38YHN0_9GAMM